MNRRIALLIFMGVLSVFILFMCLIKVWGVEKRQSGKMIRTKIDLDTSAAEWNGSLPVSGEYSAAKAEQITIPGYANLVIGGEENAVPLINPSGNNVYMVYSISHQGRELFKTGAITPGTAVDCNLAKILEPGEYNLKVLISTYDVEDFEPCNGATMDVNVKIK